MIDVVMPREQTRLTKVLDYALASTPHRFVTMPQPDSRVLFALGVDACGMDARTLALLRSLRAQPDSMRGCIGSLLVDGESELYTKQLAQELTLSANMAGCLFPGKPLVEGTLSLYNQHILAQQTGESWLQTYCTRARALVRRLDSFTPPCYPRPKLLMLHASEYGRSSTLALWQKLRPQLDFCELREISLQNGTIHDCRGCSYSACLHYAQNGACFYGGAIAETVLPAIRESNALLLLCPNYNDAVGANITALFNRLTSLLLRGSLEDKYLFGMIVSGYSGSDLVAKQLLGAMCLNKTLMLPPRFSLLETANDVAALSHIDALDAQLAEFAAQLRETLLQQKEESV